MWESFAVISGGAAAGLTGLLFVAVTLRIDGIAASSELRNRAAQTLVLFMTIVITSLILVIPQQPDQAVGGEIIALALATATFLFVLDRRASQTSNYQPIAKTIESIPPNTVTPLAMLAAGITLECGADAGFFVLVFPIMAGLVGGVINAWLLLTKVVS